MHIKKKQNRLLLLDDYIKKSIFVFAILRFTSIFSCIPPNPHQSCPFLLPPAFYMYAVRFAIYKGEERRKRGNNTTPTRSKSSILIYVCLEIFRSKKTISKEVKNVI